MAESDRTFPNIDEYDPEEIEVETINAFHLGGDRFSASFELDDGNLEAARSYLLEIELGTALTFRERLRIEDSLRDHWSDAVGRHLALEIGGILHRLDMPGEARVELPEGVLTRVWRGPDGRHFCFGEGGVTYAEEGTGWRRIPNATDEVLADMHGRTPDAIWCAGWHGTLLRLAGYEWEPQELGVQDQFDALQVTGEGSILLGGEGGVAYALENEELIPLKAEDWDYTAICEFKGHCYWTDANYGISRQQGRRVEPFRELGQGFRMQASADLLVVSGWKEVFLFDGKKWSGFELGYDGNIFLRRLDMGDYGG